APMARSSRRWTSWVPTPTAHSQPHPTRSGSPTPPQGGRQPARVLVGRFRGRRVGGPRAGHHRAVYRGQPGGPAARHRSRRPAAGWPGAGTGVRWGSADAAGTTYRVSFFAKASPGFTAPLTVSLRSDAGRTWASATVAGVTADWARYTTTLTVPAKTPPSVTNR